jgi:TonB family protein
VRTLFQTFDPPASRKTRWLSSVAIHAILIAGVLTIPIAFHEAVKPAPPLHPVALYEPTPYVPRRIHVNLPRTISPKIVIKTTPNTAKVIPPPVPVVVKIPPPPVPARKAIEIQAEAPKIEAARIAEPKFLLTPAPAPAPAAPKAPVQQVKLGGFGDPNGVPASPTSTAHSTLAKIGGFDLPEGAGHGGAGGKARVVASAGFGEGGIGSGGNGPGGNGPGGNRHGSVRSAGFGDAAAGVPMAAKASPPAAPSVTPVEILSKPRPAYTAAAREQKVEGEVQLEVLFSSDGEIHVMRVVRGLGLGLDESAREAASRIRFRPGTRGGVPVDMRGIVHIVFELS